MAKGKGNSKVKTESEKKDAFKVAAEKKVNTALRAISALAKLANPNKYAHSAAHVDQIKETFAATLKQAFDALEGKRIPSGGFTLS